MPITASGTVSPSHESPAAGVLCPAAASESLARPHPSPTAQVCREGCPMAHGTALDREHAVPAVTPVQSR
jgi:hypothetical protein